MEFNELVSVVSIILDGTNSLYDGQVAPLQLKLFGSDCDQRRMQGFQGYGDVKMPATLETLSDQGMHSL